MAIRYTLDVQAEGAVSPITSGKPEESLRAIINQLKRMSGVGFPVGTNAVSLRHTAVAASGTVTAAAVQVNDTVTINGTALTAKQKNATGTVTCATVVDDDTVTINGFEITFKDTVTDSATQVEIGVDDTATAANLVTFINSTVDDVLLNGVVTAKSALGVVTIRAYTAGTGGNSITLASSDGGTLAVSGATLANGAAAANNEFDCVGTDSETATAMAAAVNASTTDIISKVVTGAAASAVVTLTAKPAGHCGNAVTLASSNGTRLAVSGARLTGGSDTLVSVSA
jgi:hypothetical protein